MKQEVTEEYVYSFDGEFCNGDFFDSREVALEEARRENTSFWLGGKTTVKIGKVMRVCPVIDGIQLLEMLGDEMYADFDDYALEYLRDAPREAVTELEDKLNDVLYAWMVKHDQLPKFYNVVEEKTVGL